MQNNPLRRPSYRFLISMGLSAKKRQQRCDESAARSKPFSDSSTAFATTIPSDSNSMPYTIPNTKLSDEAYLLSLQA